MSVIIYFLFLTLKQSVALSLKPGTLLLTTTCLLQHLCRQDDVWEKKKEEKIRLRCSEKLLKLINKGYKYRKEKKSH